MITQSGAEYAYFRHAFGSLSAFIFCWVCTLVLKPSQLAIICLAFAKYTVEAFTSECEAPAIIVQLLGATTIGTYNVAGLRFSFYFCSFISASAAAVVVVVVVVVARLSTHDLLSGTKSLRTAGHEKTVLDVAWSPFNEPKRRSMAPAVVSAWRFNCSSHRKRQLET